MIRCPACDSLQHKLEAFLGKLGKLRWYRCRYCGMDFNRR